MVLNSQIPLLAGLLIKYQRLPRGFLWNTSLPPLVDCSIFGKENVTITYEIEVGEMRKEVLERSVVLWDLEFRNYLTIVK